MATNTVHQISIFDNDGVVLCYHKEPAAQCTSRTDRNPNREFYNCAKRRDDPKRCKFFVWEDEYQLRRVNPATPGHPQQNPEAAAHSLPTPSSLIRTVKLMPKTPKTPSSGLSAEQRARRYQHIAGSVPSSPTKQPVPLSQIPTQSDPFVSSQPPPAASQYKLAPVRGSELAGPLTASQQTPAVSKASVSGVSDDTDDYLSADMSEIDEINAVGEHVLRTSSSSTFTSSMDVNESISQHTPNPQRLAASLASPPPSVRGPASGSKSRGASIEEPIEVPSDDEDSDTSPRFTAKEKGKARAIPEEFGTPEPKGRRISASSYTSATPPRGVLPQNSSSPGGEDETTEPDNDDPPMLGPKLWHMSEELEQLAQPFSDVLATIKQLEKAVAHKAKETLAYARRVYQLELELVSKNSLLEQAEEQRDMYEDEMQKARRRETALQKSNQRKVDEIESLKKLVHQLRGA